jgi:hypothetical protein
LNDDHAQFGSGNAWYTREQYFFWSLVLPVPGLNCATGILLVIISGAGYFSGFIIRVLDFAWILFSDSDVL